MTRIKQNQKTRMKSRLKKVEERQEDCNQDEYKQ